jgi:TatD DNase family protein
MLVDSHCHLDYFSEAERPEVIARAQAAGVAEMVTIGVTLSQSHAIRAIAEAVPGVWCSVGVHPNHAADEGPVPAPEVIAAMTAHPKVIGIGESGLDYYYDKAPKDVQEKNFRAHIRAAQLTGLPLAIHARDADDDIARILGGYISFSGILTFPKSTELREIAAGVPLDRLLVETDAPYLAPVPYRGKRNEPAHTVHTAKILSEVKGLTADALAELTTRNFRTLYRKAVV